jgi:hypothetical protein
MSDKIRGFQMLRPGLAQPRADETRAAEANRAEDEALEVFRDGEAPDAGDVAALRAKHLPAGFIPRPIFEA